jgi:hypothetical protein
MVIDMNSTQWTLDNERVICKIIPSVEVDRYEWSITFTAPLYDFLKEKYGDVHTWADQQLELILRGELPIAPNRMAKIRKGKRVSQRAIGNLIRAYGMALWFDSIEDF